MCRTKEWRSNGWNHLWCAENAAIWRVCRQFPPVLLWYPHQIDQVPSTDLQFWDSGILVFNCGQLSCHLRTNDVWNRTVFLHFRCNVFAIKWILRFFVSRKVQDRIWCSRISITSIVLECSLDGAVVLIIPSYWCWQWFFQWRAPTLGFSNQCPLATLFVSYKWIFEQ